MVKIFDVFLNLKNRLCMPDDDYLLHSIMYNLARKEIEKRIFNYYSTIYPWKHVDEIGKMTVKIVKTKSNHELVKLYLGEDND